MIYEKIYIQTLSAVPLHGSFHVIVNFDNISETQMHYFVYNGQLHNLSGPAKIIITHDGTLAFEYYIEGNPYAFADWDNVAPQRYAEFEKVALKNKII